MNKDLLKSLKWTPRDPEVQKIILSQDHFADNDQKLLFMQICRKSEAFKTEHKRDLGWTNARFDKVLKKDEAFGLLKSAAIYLGTPGRQPEVIEFTDQGRKLAEKFGLKLPKQIRGGVAHNLYVKRVSAYLVEEGYEMRAEFALSAPPISIDLYGRKGNSQIAIEMELSDWQHGLDRIKKLIEANVMDEIWLMSDKPDFVNKIRRQLKIDGILSDRVTLVTVQEFFRDRRKA